MQKYFNFIKDFRLCFSIELNEQKWLTTELESDRMRTTKTIHTQTQPGTAVADPPSLS